MVIDLPETDHQGCSGHADSSPIVNWPPFSSRWPPGGDHRRTGPGNVPVGRRQPARGSVSGV